MNKKVNTGWAIKNKLSYFVHIFVKYWPVYIVLLFHHYLCFTRYCSDIIGVMCMPMDSKFLQQSTGEKIGQYLVKIWTKYNGLVFWPPCKLCFVIFRNSMKPSRSLVGIRWTTFIP